VKRIKGKDFIVFGDEIFTGREIEKNVTQELWF
jgi:hypothetical protein